jgi:hypothetical protein
VAMPAESEKQERESALIDVKLSGGGILAMV